MINRIMPFILLFSISYSQETIGDGLSGQPLLEYVVTNYKTSTTLGYTDARDVLYGTIDLKEDDQLSCVYTGYTITLDTTQDPSTNAYEQGINCEHTWPQSMGASEEPQKSDMHHLFPCKSNVNSSRGNDPYAEIDDQDTDTWYRNDYSQETIPTEYIEEYAEKWNGVDEWFEPREDHKGDASRAMFYFYAMYNDVADTIFWNLQRDDLLDWHYYDLVDEWELNRTWEIASYQENKPNPFVLDSSLARRIWYMDDGGTDTSSIDTTEYNITINEIMQNPSAVGDSEGEWFEIYNGGIEGINLNGFIIKDNDTDLHTISTNTFVQPNGYAVLGRNADVNTNGGVTVAYEYLGFTLANGADEIVLIDPDGNTVDSVAYDGGPDWPDPNGASMALFGFETDDNNLGYNWVESDSLTYGDGDYGTPGEENFPVLDLCDSGFVEVDSMCYWEEDIDVLQDFINNSQSSSNPPPSDLSPIELGFQEWEDGRIVSLCISESTDGCDSYPYKLGGNIPSSIGDLSELIELKINTNELTGAIPISIGNLDNIEVLRLQENELTGLVPTEIWDLVNLRYLFLHGNELSGTISPDIGNLTNLISLLMSFNEFTGSIPNEIGLLSNLTKLTFSNNQISGNIPIEIGDLSNLNYIHLGNNQLTGILPSEIGNLINLETIFLYSNQVSGEIPSEIGNLENLKKLSLNDNLFTGEIPSSIGNLTNLEKLQLNGNQLSGQVPESICDLTNLQWSSDFIDWGYSYLYGNNLCPPYPDCVGEYVGNQDTTNCEPLGINDSHIPIHFTLHQNFPNPFNPTTTIQYELPKYSFVNIRIFDLNGRLVTTLVNSEETAGYKAVKWAGDDSNGHQVSAGVYLYEISAGDFRQVKKMVLLK